jgi:Leucine-rich repeat (LRR) protein
LFRLLIGAIGLDAEDFHAESRRGHRDLASRHNRGSGHDLRGLTRLQQLDLSETRITDLGLEHLSGLTNLQAVDVSGTETTDSGLQAIRNPLSEATIIKRPETSKPNAALDGS